MADSEGDHMDRRERILSLVEKLKTRKAQTSRSKVMSTTSTATRRGIHSHYKLYLGWQHFERSKYRVVTIKKGGGTRQINYSVAEPLSVTQIIEKGRKLFFPDNESYYGRLEEVEMCLGNSSGQILSEFKDLDGNPCSFQEYLKAHGLFSSQCHLYICTKTKISPVFYVNGSPAPHVRVKYQKTVQSLYEDREETTVSCGSTLSCKDITDTHVDIEHFDPLEHGFRVKNFHIVETGVSIPTEEMIQESTNMEVSCMGPDIICGVEEDCKKYLIMGVMPFIENVNYSWNKNGEKIQSSQTKQFLRVTEEGTYTVFIECGEINAQIGLPVKVTVIQPCETVSTGRSVSATAAATATSTPTMVQPMEMKEDLPTLFPAEVTATFCQFSNKAVATTTSTPTVVQPMKMKEETTFPAEVTATFCQFPNKAVATTTITPTMVQPMEMKEELPTPFPAEATSTFCQISNNAVATTTSTPTMVQPMKMKEETPFPAEVMATFCRFPNKAVATTTITPTMVQPMEMKEDLPTPFPAEAMSTFCQISNNAVATTTSTPTMVQPMEMKEDLPTPFPAELTATFCQFPNKAVATTTSTPTMVQPMEMKEDLPTPFPAEVTASLCQKSNNAVATATSNTTMDQTMKVKEDLPTAFPAEVKTTLCPISKNDVTIEKEVNRGGFGVVYEGDWNGTVVAVKQICVKRMKKLKKGVVRELQINATVRHPNLVLFLGYYIDGNNLNLVSEYIDGPNLEKILFDEGEFDFPIAKRMVTARQICGAVAYLHGRVPLIVHRDIKPDNIVLNKSLSTAKLCDMGISKFQSMNTVFTTTGAENSSQPGTPAYQAPEVLLHYETASPCTDIWSLCAVLLELFTEETVWDTTDDFVGQKIRDSMRKEKAPDGLSALLSMDCLPEIVKITISLGLQYEPTSRPAALQLCQTLKGL